MSSTPESIIDDLENDRLPLPTLPEVSSHPLAGIDHNQVSAFARLGISDSVEAINMTGGVIEVEEIKEAILQALSSYPAHGV